MGVKIVFYKPYRNIGAQGMYVQLGMIDAWVSLTWIRNTYEPGSFSLTITCDEGSMVISQPGNVVQLCDGENDLLDPMIIIRRKINPGKNPENETITVEGKSAAVCLQWALISNPEPYGAASAPAIYQAYGLMQTNLETPGIDASTMGNQFIYVLGYAPPENDSAIPSIDYSADCTDELGNSIYELAKKYEFYPYVKISLGIRYGGTPQAGYYGIDMAHLILSGFVDRTMGQSENDPIIFSEDFDNVADQEYEETIENERTVACLRHDGITADKYPASYVSQQTHGWIATVTASGADDMKMVKVDASGVKLVANASHPDAISDRTLAKIRQVGKTALGGYRKSQTIKFTPIVEDTSHLYGSRVTYYNRRWGVRVDFNVTQLQFVYENNQRKVTIAMGDPVTTMLTRMRQLNKSGKSIFGTDIAT